MTKVNATLTSHDCMHKHQTLVVGVGSWHGDDQVGWVIAERIATELDRPHITVRRATSPACILDWLSGENRLVVCDACRGLGRVGDVRRWGWPTPELFDASWSGSHDLSLTMTLRLAERLNRLPAEVIIWSIEAAESSADDGISPEVAAVLPRLVHRIADELKRHAATKGDACTSSHL